MSSYKRDTGVKSHCYVKKAILTNHEEKKEITISLTKGLVTNEVNKFNMIMNNSTYFTTYITKQTQTSKCLTPIRGRLPW